MLEIRPRLYKKKKVKKKVKKKNNFPLILQLHVDSQIYHCGN